ncbi:MAG: P1 family peptidase [Elusimicrobia bacterium]|nr:P1 family peptidase [Elusimicrobiota bacterium]
MGNKHDKKARSRELGIIIGRYPSGKHNAITDVKGVKVGQVTLRSGSGRLRPGRGPVRTGVTAIIPAPGDLWKSKLPAGCFVLNGNGEAMGLMWLAESGVLETPVAFTNTLSVGVVQKAIVDLMLGQHPTIGITDDTLTPVVMECDDSTLNDIRGQHVKAAHVRAALKAASPGPVTEGDVGAGTGMTTYEFKGGIGTASRVTPGGFTVGVLVNANHGKRHLLRINGAAVGAKIPELMPKERKDGSITVVLATDAPLDSRQLSRLARRAMLGVCRTGAIAANGSGDVCVAFSTANRIPHYPKDPVFKMTLLSDFHIDPVFEAAGDAAEEAVINSMLAAETVVGRDGNTVYALPHDRLKAVLAGKD